MAKQKNSKQPSSTIALNKRARHDYFLEERLEAGLVLEGWEVKALRAGKGRITEAYVLIKDGEAFLLGGHILARQPRGGVVVVAEGAFGGHRRAALEAVLADHDAGDVGQIVLGADRRRLVEVARHVFALHGEVGGHAVGHARLQLAVLVRVEEILHRGLGAAVELAHVQVGTHRDRALGLVEDGLEFGRQVENRTCDQIFCTDRHVFGVRQGVSIDTDNLFAVLVP